jgi:gas vesicle protein
MSGRFFKYAAFAAAGGAVGAAVALLTAPASGKETRERLTTWLHEDGDPALAQSYEAYGFATDYTDDRALEIQRRLAS